MVSFPIHSMALLVSNSRCFESSGSSYMAINIGIREEVEGYTVRSPEYGVQCKFSSELGLTRNWPVWVLQIMPVLCAEWLFFHLFGHFT